jgi:hypothetical protein
MKHEKFYDVKKSCLNSLLKLYLKVNQNIQHYSEEEYIIMEKEIEDLIENEK